jgi:hypothetical protein
MTAPPSRNCSQCGGQNFGSLATCILCGAPMESTSPGRNAATFCGECGAKLEPGIAFCGECGAPAPSAAAKPVASPTPVSTPPAPRAPNAARMMRPAARPTPSTAPTPPLPTPHATEPIPRPCPNCTTPLTPGKNFCRKCGMNVVTGALPPIPTPKRAGPDVPRTPPVAPVGAAPKAKSKVTRGILNVVVPLASVVATYFLSTRFLGPVLLEKLGPTGPQMGSVMVSMLVGGIARQIMK